MGFAPQLAGPHDPVFATRPRSPGSIRRTSTIDTGRPGGIDAPVAAVDARARDLFTDTDGRTTSVGTAQVLLEVDQTGHLAVAIDDPRLTSLIGATVGAGWRRRVDQVMGFGRQNDSLRYLLLDDLPGATLVSGVASQHAATLAGRDIAEGHQSEMRELILTQADICAGWRRDGGMLNAFRVDGHIPTPLGPPAPDLVDPTDPLAWHQLPTMQPHGTRRSRRLDLGPVRDGDNCSFDAHFRDIHMDGEGLLRVVHEYTLRGTIDTSRCVATSVEATAQVLPWNECPAALSSAERIIGVPLGDLRERVRAELRGVSTCTHLNDMLRCLADVPMMLDAATAFAF